MTAFGRFSDPQIQAWLDEIAAMTLFGALFFDNPFLTDPATVEVIGGGYVRPSFVVNRSAYNMVLNANLLVWRNLPAGTHIAGAGVFDGGTGGVFRGGAMLATAVDFPSGGTYTVDIGQLALGLDVATGP